MELGYYATAFITITFLFIGFIFANKNDFSKANFFLLLTIICLIAIK